MPKYIGKRIIIYIVFITVSTFVLYSFFGIGSDSPIFDSAHFTPLADRIAVYHPDDGGALRQFAYLKPVSTSDYLYAPLFFDNPAHRVVRYGLKHQFYTFSHFKIDNPNLVDTADHSLYGYDPAQYVYSSYTYDEVFRKVYGVYDAGGIKSVTAHYFNDIFYDVVGGFPTFSYKDEAVITIKNRDDIAEFYSVLSRAVFEGYDGIPLISHTTLAIELKSGEVIDNLTFSAEQFFISSGPVSTALSKTDADTLNRLLKPEVTA